MTITLEKLQKAWSKGGKNKWAKMSLRQRVKHIKKMSCASKKALKIAKQRV